MENKQNIESKQSFKEFINDAWNDHYIDEVTKTKPIGLASKCYRFMDAMLKYNIGSHLFKYDGYATIIGMKANPYLNQDTNPWFILDENRKKYDNYLSYMNDCFFHGTMLPPNFHTKADKIEIFDYNALIDKNAQVGVLHHFDLDNVASAHMLIPNGATNPNGYTDTRLGVINNFYLASTLYNSYNTMMSRETSSYHNPSFGAENNTIENAFSVTQGAYAKFGLKGEYGIEKGISEIPGGMVVPQEFYTNDIITWSPVNHTFNFNTNGNLLPKNGTIDYSNNNSFFGNFFDLTSSLGLINSSGDKTKKFIVKSILGVNLLDETLDYGKVLSDLNSSVLKKINRKKYFANINGRGGNYIDKMTESNVQFDTLGSEDSSIIRINLMDAGNDVFAFYNTFYTYAEGDGKRQIAPFNGNGNSGVNMGKYYTYNSDEIKSKDDIINYTNEQFKQNKYKTLISRFHTDAIKRDNLSSAISRYGMSHGRNLLRKDHQRKTTNGYSDPYCRVWTYHKQYSKYSDLIRPFIEEDKDLLDKRLKASYQINRSHLTEYSVRNKTNGLIDFTPHRDDIYKKCMFSIENLAWVGNNLLSLQDKGPNGGKIMWFPPYGLTFNENIRTNWSAQQFIGRGEKIYSYVDTERNGTLSFQLLIDHPSILNAAHNLTDATSEVDDVTSTEQQILRFFAGCEVMGENIRMNEENEEDAEPIFEDIEEPPSNQTHSIVFEVFFPKNSSGIDYTVDLPNTDIRTYIRYLLQGLSYGGLGAYITNEGKNFELGDNDFFVSKINGDTYDTNDMIGGYEQENNIGCGLSVISGWSGNPERDLTVVYAIKENKITPINLKSFLAPTEEGKDLYWGYQTDLLLTLKSLQKEKNYLDTRSFGLNCKVYDTNEEQGIFGCSFNDMAQVDNLCKAGQKYDQDRVNTIKSMLDTYNVEKIELVGWSTSQGNQDSNKTLATNRAKTIKKWLKQMSYFQHVEFAIDTKDNQDTNDLDVSSEKSKKNRKVTVIIKLGTEKTDKGSTPSTTQLYDNGNNLNSTTGTTGSTVITGTTGTTGSTVITGTTGTTGSTSDLTNTINNYVNDITVNMDNILTFIEEDIETKRLARVKKEDKKYDEYDFFNFVNSENPFLRHKILEKIKYFDPAYHAITPEGFNSRLTFLHQCTRQGGTNSASDGNGNIRNLSFGAPPICVLRIGDFYNTKIVIESISISYDETMWDLNDEGIGIMPMVAKIDINFNFIGGSDISGPISRLQNAVSFNYYANTKVYDDKADKNDPLR